MHRLGEAGPGESPDRQRLDRERLIFAHERSRELVVELAPGVGHAGMGPRDLDALLVAVVAAPGLAGQGLLGALEFLLGAAKELRGVDLPAVGQYREVGEAEVDTHGRVRFGQQVGAGLHDEAREVPSGGVLDHGHGGRGGRQCAGPADRHGTDLRQVELAARRDRPPGVRGEANGLPVVLARLEPRRRDTRPPAGALEGGEEVAVRGLQVPQRLLQHHRRHLAQPGALRCLLRLRQPLGQIGGLGERQTAGSRVLTSPKGIVEDDPGAPERLGQRRPLTSRRVQAEAVPQLHKNTPSA